jgi:hypothetical protein
MNGRILPFEDRRHGEAQRLLPWLANGRIEDSERAWLEQHVAECRACERELDALRTLQSVFLHSAPPRADTTASRRAEAGWKRLRPRLRAEPAPRVSPWRALQRQFALAPRWMGAAVMAQALALFVLAFALWRPASMAPAYRTLGATPVASGNLVVAFDPQLAESRMRGLLRASEARIVDGPNDAGAYVLAVPPARVDMVRDALRAAPGVTLVATLGTDSKQ